jgi:hypothetical protein
LVHSIVALSARAAISSHRQAATGVVHGIAACIIIIENCHKTIAGLASGRPSSGMAVDAIVPVVHQSPGQTGFSRPGAPTVIATPFTASNT